MVCFYFFESRNFLTKSLGLGFLTRISASRRVSDFTIRYPFQCAHWNRLSRVCVQVDHTIRPRPHVSNFLLKMRKFFFFLAIFKIYPFTRSVFDTVKSSFSKSSVFKSPHENTKTVLSTWNHCIRKVPFLYNTQIFWSKLSFTRNNFEFSAFLYRWKLFKGCYRMTEIPEPSVQKLEDRLNNNGCINFCRDKAFPLAATSNKQCVCLNSLPTTLLAISTDGDAASGPSSHAILNVREMLERVVLEPVAVVVRSKPTVYMPRVVSGVLFQLKLTPRRSRRVVKKISATLKKVVQEWRYQFSLYRKEWRYRYHHCCHRFLLLGNFRRTKTFRSMDHDR